MTKAEVVNEISERTGVERAVVQETVESFFNVIKGSLVEVLSYKDVPKRLREIFQKTPKLPFLHTTSPSLNLLSLLWLRSRDAIN